MAHFNVFASQDMPGKHVFSRIPLAPTTAAGRESACLMENVCAFRDTQGLLVGSLLETASQATIAPQMAFASMEFANASLGLVVQIAHLPATRVASVMLAAMPISFMVPASMARAFARRANGKGLAAKFPLMKPLLEALFPQAILWV